MAGTALMSALVGSRACSFLNADSQALSSALRVTS